MNAEATVQHRLRPAALNLAQHAIFTLYTTIPPEQDWQLCLRPEYWSKVTDRLRPGCRIIVDAEDGSATMTLMVRKVTRTEAVVWCIFRAECDVDVDMSVEGWESHFEIKWRGPTHRYCVIRLSDKEQLTSGLQSRPDAVKYVMDRMKRIEGG